MAMLSRGAGKGQRVRPPVKKTRTGSLTGYFLRGRREHMQISSQVEKFHFPFPKHPCPVSGGARTPNSCLVSTSRFDAASRDGTTTEEGETGLGERHKLNLSRVHCIITLIFLLQGVEPISTPRTALYPLFDPGPTAIDAASRDGTTTSISNFFLFYGVLAHEVKYVLLFLSILRCPFMTDFAVYLKKTRYDKFGRVGPLPIPGHAKVTACVWNPDTGSG